MIDKFPRKLTRKEVAAFIDKGEAVYDSVLSISFNLPVYKFSDGRLIFKRDDGTGAYWKSLEQINDVYGKAETEIDIFNMKNWLKDKSDLLNRSNEVLETLGQKLGESIHYDQKSLDQISAIKIKNIVDEKNILYAMIMYSCNFYIKLYGGELEFEPNALKEGNHVPCVKMSNGRIFLPYSEFLKSYAEPIKITLSQSIEIEKVKYNFYK